MKAETHLAVEVFQGRENICLRCAPAVLKVAAAHYAEVANQLFPGGLP
jgi:hypothetical protein